MALTLHAGAFKPPEPIKHQNVFEFINFRFVFTSITCYTSSALGIKNIPVVPAHGRLQNEHQKAPLNCHGAMSTISCKLVHFPVSYNFQHSSHFDLSNLSFSMNFYIIMVSVLQFSFFLDFNFQMSHFQNKLLS